MSKPWQRSAQERRQAAAAATTGEAGCGLRHLYKRARATGTLNISSRELQALPEECFSLEECLEEGEKAWECSPLAKLDASHNQICDISPAIAKLQSSLLSLTLLYNSISSFPAAACCLINLKVLNISNNQLQDLPEQLGEVE
ncbi:unnamed protein product, partial [Chrysoparadoxa australica]